MRSLGLLLLLAWVPAVNAQSIEPFEVSDIRVEGIQRTEAGTVFSYLPVKVGDTLTGEKATAAIKALFATGFFKDVRLEANGTVLVVSVVERPAIAQIEVIGSKEFEKDKLKDAMKKIGLSESRIFDRAVLEKAVQELKSLYISRGKYSVRITTTVTPLERNRVALNFDISEGLSTTIKQINFVGNKMYRDDELLELFNSSGPGMWTWITKNDQYSKPKLEGDQETLRSFYLNQGFIEFAIDSTQVAISPDKKDIFITVNLTEGKKYKVTDIKLAGELLVPEEELRKLITVKRGDIFSRERLTESTKRISDRLGNEGYAFASVNAVPEINREASEVAFTLYVDPGRRTYVRRINVTGNTSTRDEVIRRELRQVEGAWFSTEKINRSRQRIDRLGYFSEVTIDTPSVPGTADQIDMNVKVTERATGNLTFGVGYSSAEKVILSGSISQTNVFGTGNALSLQINSGSINKIYALSYTNPYYTDDGVSRGFDLYRRDTNPSSLAVASYKTTTTGAGIRFGVPVTETDTINYGLGVERTELETFATTPQRYLDFVDIFGPQTTTLLGTVGWARDQRDSVIYTTEGTFKKVSLESGLPGGDLKYYRFGYQHQWYYPLGKLFTFAFNGQLGYASGYGDKPLPFYKNYFLGGVGSVRGYETSTLGPKDANGDALGGPRMMMANAELLMPFPGLQKEKSLRLSLFVDGGTVGEQYRFGEARYAAGIAMSWFSPVGPIKLSFAKALNPKPEDKLQHLQFQLGTFF
jgi:outer membrane protein insertion porin family